MKRLFIGILILLPYLYVFIASLYLPKDPDLGWHLKYGEYSFTHHSLLRQNTVTSTMQDYQWANGSWGTDLITYIIYVSGGFLGLTLASALIVTLTFFISAKTVGLSVIEKLLLFPAFVYLTVSINSISFRGQQMSLLFLSILIYILSRYSYVSKMRWLIPFLFFLWSNIHIESFFGIGVLFLWLIFEIIRDRILKKKFSKGLLRKNVILFIGSLTVTFINPFGWHIHLVALSHIGDPLLLKITDYVPFTLFTLSWWKQIGVVTLFLLLTGILFYKKKLITYLPLWSTVFVLLILSLFVRRYLWAAIYLLIPLMHYPLQLYIKEKSKTVLQVVFCIHVIALMFVMQSKLPLSQFNNMNWNTYCEALTIQCSSASAEYLKLHTKSTDKILTYYDWGGWLIWNYPEMKPSIDGRMHIWRDSNGYSEFEKYESYMYNQKDLTNSGFNTIYIPNDGSLPIYEQLSKLILQKKWRIAYKDSYSVIFIKNEARP